MSMRGRAADNRRQRRRHRRPSPNGDLEFGTGDSLQPGSSASAMLRRHHRAPLRLGGASGLGGCDPPRPRFLRAGHHTICAEEVIPGVGTGRRGQPCQLHYCCWGADQRPAVAFHRAPRSLVWVFVCIGQAQLGSVCGNGDWPPLRAPSWRMTARLLVQAGVNPYPEQHHKALPDYGKCAHQRLCRSPGFIPMRNYSCFSAWLKPFLHTTCRDISMAL